MKKIVKIITLIIITIIIIISSTFTSCTPQTEINPEKFEKSKQIALEFVQNSQIYQTHQGFDIEFFNESIKTCGQDCFEYHLKYSVLGDKIGYETTIQVTKEKPNFKSEPTALN